jgi:hypothetical protein
MTWMPMLRTDRSRERLAFDTFAAAFDSRAIAV